MARNSLGVMQHTAITHVELQYKLETYESYAHMTRRIIGEIRNYDVQMHSLILLPYLPGISNINLSLEVIEQGDGVRPGKRMVERDACVQRRIYTARNQVKAFVGDVELSAQGLILGILAALYMK
ncbi:hypothetical protein HBI17_023180 [Parastagonospora nodorum]|nr:hypothetical protein HBI17_023180 [Parastagonospora nodorum]